MSRPCSVFVNFQLARYCRRLPAYNWRVLAKVVRIARKEGLRGIWKRVVNRVRFYTEPVYTEWDKEFGVETATMVPMSKLSINSRNTAFACHYQPIGSQRFHEVMRRLPIDHSSFTFIDIGSGKGKALLLAASYPFKECVGVEFSSQLDAIAHRNFKSYRGPVRSNIRTVVQDATEFTFPDVPLVVYFYNPFEAAVIEPVLANLKQVQANPLYVVYIYPLARLSENPEERGAFDAAFTPFIEAEGCTIYRR